MERGKHRIVVEVLPRIKRAVHDLSNHVAYAVRTETVMQMVHRLRDGITRPTANIFTVPVFPRAHGTIWRHTLGAFVAARPRPLALALTNAAHKTSAATFPVLIKLGGSAARLGEHHF